jgi:hypothetical protein
VISPKGFIIRCAVKGRRIRPLACFGRNENWKPPRREIELAREGLKSSAGRFFSMVNQWEVE